jgi:hypothetical protein
MTHLVITYFVIAFVALIVAAGAFAISAQQAHASGQQTLQLHITRYHG